MSLVTEVRHAFRSLSRAPVLAGAAVLCLGLGIGATSAIYSAVYEALIRSLPFPEADRLVTVYRTTPQFDTGPFSPANFLDLRRDTRTIENLSAISAATALLQTDDEALRVTAFQVSDGFFGMLRQRPLLGRLLQEGDEAEGAPAVAVVTEEFWRDRLGGDPAILGTTVRLDGVATEVVGVLPAAFRVPTGNGMLESDFWVPLRFTPQQATTRRSNSLRLLGRLAGGATVEAAHAEMRSLMDGIVEAYPVLRGEQVRVLPLQSESVRNVRGPLLLLLGAVGFVLLIAVANVASLLLARGVSRRGEFALRTVLGAGRGAVMRSALVESAVLTGLGAVLGIALAWVGVRAIAAMVPNGLPQLRDLSVEPAVLMFSLAVSIVIAVVCGLAPAWQASRSEPQDALRASGRTGTGRGHQIFLRGLVSAEVALSLVLLLGAGLVLRGFERLVRQDPGFDPGHLLTLTVDIPADRYPDGNAGRLFLEPVLERIRAVPGVVDAGSIHLVPYDSWGWNFNIRYEGQSGEDPTRLPLVETRYATPGFFPTLGMQLVSGRLLTDADGQPDAPIVAVANQALAERDFPGEDAVGKRFHLSDTTFATIVGVVRDIRNVGPDQPSQPEVYWSYARRFGGATSFPILVRTQGEPTQATAAVTNAIRGFDSQVAITGVRTMEETIARSVGRPRFYLALIGAFAGVALLLAVAGLYGVMSYAVAQRTREIGIRSALGSTPKHTLSLVVRQGMTLIAIGAMAGLFAGFALTRLLTSNLYGVSPLDAPTWVVVTALLAAAGAVAVMVPARRAARVDPMVAMRTE